MSTPTVASDSGTMSANGPLETVLGALAYWAESTPGAPAVCLYDSSADLRGAWTYRDLAAAATAGATVLLRHVAADETLILQAPNGFEYVSWFFAGLLAGVRVAAVHPSTTVHEVVRVATNTHARAIIGPTSLSGLVHLPLSIPRTRFVDTAALTASPSSGSVILQSSGTTGAPRLARRTEPALDADARGLAGAADLIPQDRVLCVVPLSHSYGVDLLVATILAGASLQAFERFDLAGVQTLLARGDVTVLPGVPFMFEALARSAFHPNTEILRLAFSAGSPLPRRVYSELRAASGLDVGQLYGATELGTVTLSRPDRAEFDPLSAGMPVPGASVRVYSPENPGHALPAGAEGQLAVMAPSMLTEYVDGALALADGHFLTGDLGHIDARGSVYVTGRLKHLIDVGGLKVNPLEVEQALAEHPGIAECALVPLPLSETVVRLRLLFVPRAGRPPSVDELRAFARERLSPHKLPRIFEPVASLPRSATGKLLRHLLNQS